VSRRAELLVCGAMAAQPQVELVQCHYDKGMSDAAGCDGIGHFCPWHEMGDDVLALVKLNGVCADAVFDQDCVALV